MVQSLIIPDDSGRYEILVSDALLTPAAAKRLKREIIAAGDPATGQHSLRTPDRVLTVIYTLKGSTRTKQAVAGETLVLD